jgi:NADP-dependent 3-hydroxy acid dehydrogenase YdfG
LNSASASAHLHAGGIAVLTGAASGFGLEAAKLALKHQMRVVMADVQEEALHAAAAELKAQGGDVTPVVTDVANSDSVDALAQATLRAYGIPNVVFNNAGVASGGLIWENSIADWQWVLGVNLMGVVHGIRSFTPLMLEAAGKDPSWRGHVVNTASMAGLVSMPNSGIYNVSKHSQRRSIRISHSSRTRFIAPCFAHSLSPPGSARAIAIDPVIWPIQS